MKKATCIVLAVCSSLLGLAQYDTTFGYGSFLFLDTASNKAIENVDISYKAVQIDDTLFTTKYHSTSDSSGLMPFNVPTYFKITIGLDEHGLPSNTLFYPNPGNELNAMLPVAGIYKLLIYDSRGRLVTQTEFNESNHLYVSLEGLKEGMYVADIVSDKHERVASAKIIKKEGPLRGPYVLDGLPEGVGKVMGNGAIYRLYTIPPYGYKRDSTDIIIQDGANGVLTVPVFTFDTLVYSAYWQVLDTNGNPLSGARIAAMPIQMDQILVNVTYNDTTDNNGLTPVRDFIAYIDTTALGQTGTTPTYEVIAKKRGFATTTVQLNLQAGANQISMNPWTDTTGTQGILTRESATNSLIGNIPLDITVLISEDVADTTMYNTQTNSSGAVVQTLKNEIDTTGQDIFQNNGSTWIISSPYVNTMTASDSNDVNLQYTGFDAAIDTITVFNGPIGTNATHNHFKNPVPVPNWHGKQRVSISAGQFDKDFNRTVADSMLVVFSDTASNQFDSVYTDVNGVAISPLYPHNTNILIGGGYVGGVGTNGEALKMFKGVPVTIQGATYATLDTILEIKANLVPDSTNVNALGATEYISAPELKLMHEKPTVENQLDTATLYINPTNFTQIELANIQNVIDSSNTVLPIYTNTVTASLANPLYTGTNYNNTNFGMNVSQGSNNLINIQQKQSNIIGEGLEYVCTDAQVSAATAELWKEIFFQRFAFAGVPASYQLSVTNGNPSMPTTWDFANFIFKYHFEHEMFKGTTPASTGTPTQNISIDYYYDDVNISAQ